MDDEKFLNFEEPIKELAQKLSALRTAAVDSPALNDEILNLEKEFFRGSIKISNSSLNQVFTCF